MKVIVNKNIQNGVSLDAFDYKLLSSIQKNARFSLSSVSKQLKKSRTAIEYRISQFEKNGVIQEYVSIINLKKLGYFSHHIFIESSEYDKILIERAMKNSSVNTIITYSGKISLEISFLAKTPSQCEVIIGDLFKGLPITYSYFTTICSTIVSRVLPEENLFLPQKSLDFVDYTIDTKDIELLLELSHNARGSLFELSSKLDIPYTTIRRKVDLLRKSGYLIEHRIALNYDALGYSLQGILLKVVKRDVIEKIENFFIHTKGVIWAARCIGSVDYLIYFASISFDEFHQFISQLKSDFGNTISMHEIFVAYAEHKYSFFAPVILEDWNKK